MERITVAQLISLEATKLALSKKQSNLGTLILDVCKSIYIKYFSKWLNINNPLYKVAVKAIGLDVDLSLTLDKHRTLKGRVAANVPTYVLATEWVQNEQ